jgi:hypothetical protein
MNTSQDQSTPPESTSVRRTPPESTSVGSLALRGLTAVVIVVVVLTYTVAVVAGGIAPNRQLSATDILLLLLAGVAVTVIIWPAALRDIKILKFGTSGLEFERMQEQQGQLQEEQGQLEDKQSQLEDMLKEIFPFLVPDHLLKHLRILEARAREPNGAAGRNYTGTNVLRDELRQLRNMHMIEMIAPYRGMRDVPENDVDLAAYVRLTDRGREWMSRVSSWAAPPS